MMRKILLWASLGFMTILLGASLVPGTWRPHTPLETTVEHFAAYALVAFWFTVILARWPARAASAGILIALAAALEFVQTAIPGRTGELIDFVYSTAGVLLGLAAGWVAIGFAAAFRRGRPRTERPASSSGA